MFVLKRVIQWAACICLVPLAGWCCGDFDNAPSARCGDEKPGVDQRPKLEEKQKDREKQRDSASKLSPEQREAKRNEIKARLEKRLAELRGKSTNGTLSAEERRELTRREQILKRFEQNTRPAKDRASDPKPEKPRKAGKD